MGFSIREAVTFTRLEGRLNRYAFEVLGIEIMGTEGQRFKTRQAYLYSTRASKTLRSDHLYCRARDIDVIENGQVVGDGSHWAYAMLGQYWKSLDPGCYWGGDWKSKDSRHFGYNPRRTNK